MKRIDRSSKVRTGFHQAKWDEPIIYELSTPGERGILVGQPEKAVAEEVEGEAAIPAGMAEKYKIKSSGNVSEPLYYAIIPDWHSRHWAPM